MAVSLVILVGQVLVIKNNIMIIESKGTGDGFGSGRGMGDGRSNGRGNDFGFDTCY
jgi:hypothetical protein